MRMDRRDSKALEIKFHLWGCLGNQGILYTGSPTEIRNEIYRLDRISKKKAVICSARQAVADEMPIEKPCGSRNIIERQNPV